jgi:DNA-binding NarL/FixJ family response regulator
MAGQQPIRVLLVEDHPDFFKLVEVFLKKHEPEKFQVTWKQNGTDALHELGRNPNYDVILMDYFLPGPNGLETTRALQQRGVRIPVIFLTVNKDFDLAVEVMKVGIEDYLVKEEISTPVLPKTILNVIERQKLKEQLMTLEISQKRLETIRELIGRITAELRLPLDGMRQKVDELLRQHANDNLKSYLAIIRDNLDRIERKIVSLKTLKTDKTIQYIKDIRMIDLSDGNTQDTDANADTRTGGGADSARPST